LSVIGWKSLLLYDSWSGLLQFVFVAIYGAWVVCIDRVFYSVFRGQAARG